MLYNLCVEADSAELKRPRRTRRKGQFPLGILALVAGAVPLSLQVSDLKASLHSLTGVPSARQKLMGFKAGVPSDDAVSEISGNRPK